MFELLGDSLYISFRGDTIQPTAGRDTTLNGVIKEGLSVDNAFRSRSVMEKVIEWPWLDELTELVTCMGSSHSGRKALVHLGN